MSKLVVFNIGEGNFEQGFPVTLLVGEEGKLPYKDHQDKLPPAPELPELYRQWQQKYYGLEPMRRVIKIPPAQITNVSSDDCEKAAQALEACVKEWFDQRSLVTFWRHVGDEVKPNESVRIIFQTQDELLRKLPWHLWYLFECLPNAEFSISGRYAPSTPTLHRPVKILAILGGDEGIDTTADLDILKKLPGAKVTPLKKPKQGELNDELWNQHWDILFFAGHSPNSEFAQKANILWEGGVNWRTAMGYDATQAMVEGLRRINGSPERYRLRQVLSRPDFSAIGATGKVEFERSGDRKLSPNIGVLGGVQK